MMKERRAPHTHARISILAAILSCGGSVTTQPDAGACTPNTQIQCTGANGCVGMAMCNSDGTAVGACGCTDATSDAAVNDAYSEETGAPTDGGIDAPVWTPKQLPGLCAWLDDTFGITLSVGVSVWADRSGNGNDAVQPSSQSQPVLGKNVLQGHDVVQMTNNRSLTIKDAACLHFGTGPFFVAAVALVVGSTGQNGLFMNKSTNSSGFYWSVIANANQKTDIYATTQTASVTLSNVPYGFHVLELRGPALQFSINGVTTDGGGATDDISAVGQDVLIGQSAIGEVDIAELVIVSGVAISTQDEANIQSYFANKFGI